MRQRVSEIAALDGWECHVTAGEFMAALCGVGAADMARLP